MARPKVSVVMPFAGDAGAAREAVATLRSLSLRAGDELILADNSGSAVAVDDVRIVRATREASPAHARNIGAAAARCEWILFIDADCHVPADLIDRYLESGVDPDVGALAGDVIGIATDSTLAGRYGAARNFLGQQVHQRHPYLPRAAAANLMVRRSAFEAVGGFHEGVRAAEDTDFSWRLQQAGWRLAPRPQATVEHVYRRSLRELRRQWRGYAAGRAWLARRYDEFTPEPALKRLLRRSGVGPPRRTGPSRRTGPPRRTSPPRRTGPPSFLAIDVLLGIEELAGLTLSNRPASRDATAPADVVLVAERFPAAGDPRADFVRTLQRPRVEAAARPRLVDLEVARAVEIAYREDDGFATRLRALIILLVRHPLRCLRDARPLPGQGPSLASLAPAALRLARDPSPRLRALGGSEAQLIASRIAALTGMELDS